MAGPNNLKVLGRIEDTQKNIIAQEFIRVFSEKFPSVCGELYLGYPIYIDEIANRQTCVDIALISRIGVYVINILKNAVTDYGQIQDDIYAKVESKFKKQPFLFKRRKLVFDWRWRPLPVHLLPD